MLDRLASVIWQTVLPLVAAAGLGSPKAEVAGSITKVNAALDATALRRIDTVWHAYRVDESTWVLTLRHVGRHRTLRGCVRGQLSGQHVVHPHPHERAR